MAISSLDPFSNFALPKQPPINSPAFPNEISNRLATGIKSEQLYRLYVSGFIWGFLSDKALYSLARLLLYIQEYRLYS